MFNIYAELVNLGKNVASILREQRDQTVKLNLLIEKMDLSIKKSDEIIAMLSPPPPVKFRIALIQGEDMPIARKAGVDFQMFDNGQAVATLTPVDSVGIDTTLPEGTSTPLWKSSDPGIVVSPSTDGMSAIITPAAPPVLVQNATISVMAALPDSSTITGTSENIDVVAGGPTGFKVALS